MRNRSERSLARAALAAPAGARERGGAAASGLEALPADVLIRVADRLAARDEYALARASTGMRAVLGARTAGVPVFFAAERAARPRPDSARILAAVAAAQGAIAADVPAVLSVSTTATIAVSLMLAAVAWGLMMVAMPLTVLCAVLVERGRSGRWQQPMAIPGSALVFAAARVPGDIDMASRARAEVASGCSPATRLGLALAPANAPSTAGGRGRGLFVADAGHLLSPPEVEAALAAALLHALRSGDAGQVARVLAAGARPDAANATGGTPLWAARRLHALPALPMLQVEAAGTLHRLLGGAPGPLRRRLVREWLAAGGTPLYTDAYGLYPRERALATGDAELLDALDAAARDALAAAIAHDDTPLALRALVAGTPWPARGAGSLEAVHDGAAAPSPGRDILRLWGAREADAVVQDQLRQMCSRYRISTPSARHADHDGA